MGRMLTLKAYLQKNREKQKDFAARIGASEAAVSRFCKGVAKPSLQQAHDIERATKGKVKTEVWLDPPAPAKKTASVVDQVPA